MLKKIILLRKATQKSELTQKVGVGPLNKKKEKNLHHKFYSTIYPTSRDLGTPESKN